MATGMQNSDFRATMQTFFEDSEDEATAPGSEEVEDSVPPVQVEDSVPPVQVSSLSANPLVEAPSVLSPGNEEPVVEPSHGESVPAEQFLRRRIHWWRLLQ